MRVSLYCESWEHELKKNCRNPPEQSLKLYSKAKQYHAQVQDAPKLCLRAPACFLGDWEVSCPSELRAASGFVQTFCMRLTHLGIPWLYQRLSLVYFGAVALVYTRHQATMGAMPSHPRWFGRSHPHCQQIVRRPVLPCQSATQIRHFYGKNVELSEDYETQNYL